MSKFEEIYHSITMMGNKLINVKTNQPVNSEDITPKNYVDEKSIYNTPTVVRFNHSPKFEWVRNIQNNTIKNILDKLLFPVINPTYIEPKFEYVKVYISNLYNTNGWKKIIFYDTEISCTISFKINPGDRIPNGTTSIVIRYDNNELQYFNAETTSNESTINFTLKLNKNIKSIDLIRRYSPININNYKKDNYDSNYIPNSILQEYVLFSDIKSYIEKNYVLVPPMLIKQIENTNEFETIFDNIVNNQEISDLTTLKNNQPISLHNFIKSNLIYVDDNNDTKTENLLMIGLPEELVNKYQMNINVNNFIDNFIPKHLMYYNNTLKIKTLRNYDTPNNYVFFILNVGIISQNERVDFYFKTLMT